MLTFSLNESKLSRKKVNGSAFHRSQTELHAVVLRVCVAYTANNNNNNNNSIQFFIISVLQQQPEGQLQMQHKRRQNNKYNKITTIRL
jgi:hypothetical protein